MPVCLYRLLPDLFVGWCRRNCCVAVVRGASAGTCVFEFADVHLIDRGEDSESSAENRRSDFGSLGLLVTVSEFAHAMLSGFNLNCVFSEFWHCNASSHLTTCFVLLLSSCCVICSLHVLSQRSPRSTCVNCGDEETYRNMPCESRSLQWLRTYMSTCKTPGAVLVGCKRRHIYG